MEWYFCLPSLLLSCNISFSDSFIEFEEKRIFKIGTGKIFYSIWQMREREREIDKRYRYLLSGFESLCKSLFISKNRGRSFKFWKLKVVEIDYINYNTILIFTHKIIFIMLKEFS